MKIIKSNWAEWIENILSYGLTCYGLLLPYFSWYFLSNGVKVTKVFLIALLFFLGIFVFAIVIGLLVYIISYPLSKTYIIYGYNYFVYKNNKVMFSDISTIRYNFSVSYRNHHDPGYAYILYKGDYLKIEKFSPFLLLRIKVYNPKIIIRFPNFKNHFIVFPVIFFFIGIILTIIEHFV